MLPRAVGLGYSWSGAVSVLAIGLRATCPFGGEGVANSTLEGMQSRSEGMQSKGELGKQTPSIRLSTGPILG